MRNAVLEGRHVNDCLLIEVVLIMHESYDFWCICVLRDENTNVENKFLKMETEITLLS